MSGRERQASLTTFMPGYRGPGKPRPVEVKGPGERRKEKRRRFKELKVLQFDVECEPTFNDWARVFLRLEAFRPVEGPPGEKKGNVELSICFEGYKQENEETGETEINWRAFHLDRIVHNYLPIKLALGAVLQQMLVFGWTLADCFAWIRRELEEYLKRHPKIKEELRKRFF